MYAFYCCKFSCHFCTKISTFFGIYKIPIFWKILISLGGVINFWNRPNLFWIFHVLSLVNYLNYFNHSKTEPKEHELSYFSIFLPFILLCFLPFHPHFILFFPYIQFVSSDLFQHDSLNLDAVRHAAFCTEYIKWSGLWLMKDIQFR